MKENEASSGNFFFFSPVICLKHICYKVKKDITSELPGERSDCSFNFTVTAGKVRFFSLAVNVFWERIICSVPFVRSSSEIYCYKSNLESQVQWDIGKTSYFSWLL